MFHTRYEQIIVEIEIADTVVFRKQYTVPAFERSRQMLKRKAIRDAKGKYWSIFVIKGRKERTRAPHRKIPIDATCNI